MGDRRDQKKQNQRSKCLHGQISNPNEHERKSNVLIQREVCGPDIGAGNDAEDFNQIPQPQLGDVFVVGVAGNPQVKFNWKLPL